MKYLNQLLPGRVKTATSPRLGDDKSVKV